MPRPTPPIPPHIQNALAQITGEVTPGMRRLLKAGWTIRQLALALMADGRKTSAMNLARQLRRKDLQTIELRNAIEKITGVKI